jgi:beta-glucosidase
VLEPGEFTVEIGSSSRDIRLSTTINVDSPPVLLPLTIMSTAAEWLADPEGRDLLEAVLKQVVGADPANYEALPEIIGSIPLATLASFQLPGLTPEVLNALQQSHPPAPPAPRTPSAPPAPSAPRPQGQR